MDDDLIGAAKRGDVAAVQALLAKGANVNAKDNYGDTALMEASAKGHREVVQVLLDKGADVNAKTYRGHTALMPASNEGHREVVQALLDKGADVNAKDNDGWTALIYASSKGHHEVAQVLLENGANPKDSITSKDGERIGLGARIGCFILSLLLFTLPIFCIVWAFFFSIGGRFGTFAGMLLSIHRYAPGVYLLLMIGMAIEFWPPAGRAFRSAIFGRNLLGK